MQKTIQELEAEFDALIVEFDAATRGLWPRCPRAPEIEFCEAYRVAKIIPFPTRETLH